MRFRLAPTPAQEQALLEHCSHARYVWNLAVEQHQRWRPGRASAPGYGEQSRQLTEARKAFAWLAAGSQTVQQQALRDFAQAMSNFFAGTHGRPTWRKAGVHEGFRIVGRRGLQWDVRRLSRKVGEVWVPKVGWVRFRWSRQVPDSAKSFRLNRDRAGRWHVCFPVIPPPIIGPGTGEVVGVDRGVAVSAALSTGERLSVPGLRDTEAERLRRLQRRLARAEPGSNRRARVKMAIGRIKARETDRRKDWVEKTSTYLARRYDLIRVEDLKIRNMVRSARGTIDAPGKNVRAKAGLHSRGWLGSAGEASGTEGPRPSGEDQSCVHLPDLSCLQVSRCGEPREPSGFSLSRLRACRSRGCERGQEHRRRTDGDSAGSPPATRRGREPRTSTCSHLRVGTGLESLASRRGRTSIALRFSAGAADHEPGRQHDRLDGMALDAVQEHAHRTAPELLGGLRDRGDRRV
jgi:transposase